MTLAVSCPACGEADRAKLKPERREKWLTVICRSCGHRWEQNTARCPECEEAELVPVRMPLLQKARGTQQSIIGYRSAQKCPACGWASEGPAETNAAE